MANPVELYCGTRLLFRFNPTPSNIGFNLNKVGNSNMDLPTYIRPWMFDFTSQDRTLSVTVTLMNISAYDPTIPGTGTILDQLEDLLYIQSCNWTIAGTKTYLELFVPYPLPLSAGHNLTTLYPATGNADYLMDQNSIPTGVYPAGGPTRSLSDKIYYVYPQAMDFPRDEASVNRVHVTLTFKEIQEAIKI
jgi:hypothetical protein